VAASCPYTSQPTMILTVAISFFSQSCSMCATSNSSSFEVCYFYILQCACLLCFIILCCCGVRTLGRQLCDRWRLMASLRASRPIIGWREVSSIFTVVSAAIPVSFQLVKRSFSVSIQQPIHANVCFLSLQYRQQAQLTRVWLVCFVVVAILCGSALR
jgi:hypothetical protein